MKTTLLFLSVFLSATLFGQNVYIPDANFKAYLVGNSEINTNGDNEIQVSETSSFTGAILCNDLSISDLTGIEAFTALTFLECSFNQLTSIDVSSNTALTFLDCSGNNLTSLDVSSNTALTYLVCYSNQLTSLDISNNTALTLLSFSNNQIISLDLSNNTFLTDLYCEYNQLTSLDVSNNTVLIRLHCFFNQLECLNIKNGNNNNMIIFLADANPNLTCIEVDDAEWSTANWDVIDDASSFSEDCNYPENCDDSSVGISELTTSKNLIQILDLMGRETSFKPNTPLIYVYDDGSIEKVFSVEY
jgi:Leucine-rich repeat (LRR) protein